MSVETVWRNVSLGIFLVALGVLVVLTAEWWRWMFVLFAGMSLLNAVVKRRWRWLPHPLLWGAGLTWAFLDEEVSVWGTIWILLGISLILGYFIGLVPRRRDPAEEGPRPPGAGVVIDAEVTGRGE